MSVLARQVRWVHWGILQSGAGRYHRILWQVKFNSMQCGNGPQRIGLSDEADIDEWAWQRRERGAYVKVSREDYSCLSSPRKSESHTWKESWAGREGWECVWKISWKDYLNHFTKDPWLWTWPFRSWETNSKAQRELRCFNSATKNWAFQSPFSFRETIIFSKMSCKFQTGSSHMLCKEIWLQNKVVWVTIYVLIN